MFNAPDAARIAGGSATEPEELLQHIPPAYPAGAVSAFAWAAL